MELEERQEIRHKVLGKEQQSPNKNNQFIKSSLIHPQTIGTSTLIFLKIENKKYNC